MDASAEGASALGAALVLGRAALVLGDVPRIARSVRGPVNHTAMNATITVPTTAAAAGPAMRAAQPRERRAGRPPTRSRHVG